MALVLNGAQSRRFFRRNLNKHGHSRKDLTLHFTARINNDR
jgi:hypothetical protein